MFQKRQEKTHSAIFQSPVRRLTAEELTRVAGGDDGDGDGHNTKPSTVPIDSAGFFR